MRQVKHLGYKTEESAHSLGLILSLHEAENEHLLQYHTNVPHLSRLRPSPVPCSQILFHQQLLLELEANLVKRLNDR